MDSRLTCHDMSTDTVGMATIKISSKVEEQVWESSGCWRKSRIKMSRLLTEAISDYLQRRRIRPAVLDHLSDSMNENDELGKLLAR